MKKTQLEKLTAKKQRLSARLEKAKEKSLQTFNNLGWGAGMRKAKLVSFSAEMNIEAQINDIDNEIAGLHKRL